MMMTESSSGFSEIKEYCLQLLQLIRNPNDRDSTTAISNFLQFIRRSPPHALQPFFDYTLVPLLLLLESAVNCRSSPNNDLEEKPPKISDAVAEGVIQCLEQLLMKCHIGSIDQMVVILKKLTNAALLSPLEASEEFREGIIKCFKSVINGLYSCSNSSCTCNKITGKTFSQSFQENEINSEECLLAFLQSESASGIVGHWISLLLKAADVEAARGHVGSSKLRVEAFVTLRVLVAKVGTADRLAFFLPGVVIQIGKVLHVSKTMISGAAGSMEALDQAIRSLTEFLIIVLNDDANLPILDQSDINLNSEKSSLSFLEDLRHLPTKKQDSVEILAKKSTQKSTPSAVNKSLRVDRTRDWLATASSHVNKILSAVFPHLCVHPAKRVRKGTVAAIKGLLSTCSQTLKESRLMLLECLCALVCDEDEEVSKSAQMFLENLLSSSGKHHIERDFSDIFNRLFEKLPEAVVSGEQSLAHTQKLLVLIYYSGPTLVKERLLHSPVTAARFFDTLTLCLSQNSVFAGSLDKLLLEKSSSVGYLRSITEMKAATFFSNEKKVDFESNSYEESNTYKIQNEYDLPRMPPWFAAFKNQKLYQSLAGILRLVSLSLVAGSASEGNLSIIKDIPLSYLRKLISDLRNKEYTKERWQSWYNRTNSGKLVRQASTAVCILNEMIFGLSDQSVTDLKTQFHNNVSGWDISVKNNLRNQLVDCIGSILHEYLSPEIWNLPLQQSNIEDGDGDFKIHFFQDNAMLHQVMIDGIGIFNLCLKNDFVSNGFLHSCLYVLLENLICSNFQVKRASDAVLHVISATSGYPTVGHLVLANSDYVIDSICRQLRHLDLNPHVPSVLAAILSYIGVAHKILPLLEEPMRSVSQELEILGRHKHPELTISFLKAVAEIAKASKLEACSLPTQAESYHKHVVSELSDNNTNKLEDNFFKIKESKSFRKTVGSISISCITAAIPLLTSLKQTACLIALQIIEDGIVALSGIEESYKQEMKTREILLEALQSNSFHDLADTLESENDGNEENRLLPAMNKVWPFLIACIRNANPLTSRRCADVISKSVQICGGDFFSRRFVTDGSHLWKLLTVSPFNKPPTNFKEKRILQLPYRSILTAGDDPRAEISDLKVQVAVLEMIGEISRNKKSASAFDSVVKKIGGMVVGIAISGVSGLKDASVKALKGLASIDSDLIWLLIADVYYSKKRENVAEMPPVIDLPQVYELVKPPLSRNNYLYAQYGGQSYGFEIDFTAVEYVFNKLFKDDVNIF